MAASSNAGGDVCVDEGNFEVMLLFMCYVPGMRNCIPSFFFPSIDEVGCRGGLVSRMNLS